MIRAGPVAGPHRRMDSNMLLWRSGHGVFLLASGPKVLRLEMLAVESEEAILGARSGTLMMSRRVEVTVIWRLRRPIQTVIAIRSVCRKLARWVYTLYAGMDAEYAVINAHLKLSYHRQSPLG